MTRWLEFSNELLFAYYLMANLVYLVLLLVSIVAAARHRSRLASLRMETLDRSPLTLPMTVLVPAHNEAEIIVESVRALLRLEYPELEIVIINDGSTDATLEKLETAFALRRSSILYVPRVTTAAVRGLYVSEADERLMVLDKASGGTKSDAINAGLNAASSPYVAVIDADSVLEPDALLRIGAHMFASEREVVATGGIVRVLNGSRMHEARVTEVRLPRRACEVLQVIEYLRAFLIARQAWGAMSMLPIVSGAFGVFSRERLLQVGGFRREAIGEDLDLVVRMHRALLNDHRKYAMPFIPEPTCWTQAPDSLSSLGRQRARWQQGLMDVLWRNRDMLFRPRYGRLGWLMLPYLWVFELAAPLIEALGLLLIAVAAAVGHLSGSFLLQFALYGYAFATLISIGAVVQEEITVRRYQSWSDVARLLVYCFAEHFPYRQMNIWWRLRGMWNFLRGNLTWETAERRALDGGVTDQAKA
jgi:cellulose synthase/poly-beta-1,6-N-acetylglucosamine synthase-like glycosyltransferase